MIYYIFFTILILAALFFAWQISVADFRRRIIPDVYLFPLLITGLVIVTWFHWVTDIKTSVMGAAFGYMLATIIGFIFTHTKKYDPKTAIAPIGLGDVKLIATGGIWMGPSGLAGALVISCILGIIWGRAHNQQYIPFAPFFIIGGILSLISQYFLL